MPVHVLVVLMLAVALPVNVGARERSDWAQFFDAVDATGTIVVVDERENSSAEWVHDSVRAERRFSPASTFKIPHSLFALDAGVVRDEFQIFEWDGVERSITGHNRNQNLRSAFRVSAIWVYERFSRAIGEEAARSYLKRANYGNADPTTEVGVYWVDGNLAISAREQISFLKRLYQNQLAFDVEHQRLVKDIMIVEAEKDWILRAKTGWDGGVGWWAGWIEWPSGPVFFALNIDTPNRLDDLFKREQIGRAVLRSIDAFRD